VWLRQFTLSRGSLVVTDGTGTARRATTAIPELADINLQFFDRPAEGIAMHPKLPRGTALIAAIFMQNGRNETSFKFTHRFGIKNITAIHLLYECF
jgi:hypothetical protein